MKKAYTIANIRNVLKRTSAKVVEIKLPLENESDRLGQSDFTFSYNSKHSVNFKCFKKVDAWRITPEQIERNTESIQFNPMCIFEANDKKYIINSHYISVKSEAEQDKTLVFKCEEYI